MTERTPDWYFKASNELLLNHDTEDTRALLEEARAGARAGQEPKALAAALKAKGARNNAPGVVARAWALEMPGVLRKAAEDLAAGRTDTPAMARVRAIAASHLPASAAEFAAKMKEHGVPDTLVAHFAADPTLRADSNEQAWIFIGIGIAAAVGAIWFYTSAPPGITPYASGAVAFAAALLVWRGVSNLTRK